MEPLVTKISRKPSRVRKHQRDYANIPGGFISGNVRYNRRNPMVGKGMGRARQSSWF